MFKDGKIIIAVIITWTFNCSIASRKFPSLQKKVKPINNDGATNVMSNCRLIFIIPTFGKIMEQLVHSQCSKYLEENSLFSTFQHGFRKVQSISTCLVQFLDKHYHGIDSGGVDGVVKYGLWILSAI